MEFPALDIPDDGKLTANITHFARALRKAGLRVGPARTLDAIAAVAAAGFSSRSDFYWTLHACFVSRPEERLTFAQVFRLFWRDPRYLEHMMSLMLPAVKGAQEARAAAAAEKRAAEALLDGANAPVDQPEGEAPEELEIDASRTASSAEQLRSLDFEQMSVAEMAEARRMLSQLSLPVKPRDSRRWRSAAGRRIDRAATLREAMRRGGEIGALKTRTQRPRAPVLVVLCDISGSMSAYSRVVLHFLHTVANARGQGWARVHGFTFGTRLTNITRHLATRDVDAALAAAGAQAQDWQGGTRIGEALHRFNRDWSRRVLGGDAVVVLISDGLDRGDPELLSREAERLQKSCRRIIWVNPLLRWDGFLPQAQGIRALLPHVSSFRAGHNIEALEALADAIGRPGDQGEKARLMALLEP
ncbi:vWA domain-containing protein [Frigidibacter sp. ROC022]|uniref:vWA domain-containing protein n=1 Tax=Frigidibacter sp. ROC022 TaxID=2971796 RepID=UPI00215A5EA7|nr:VWA domain-containing protein [Frigidibacter sp. ROC022]